MLILTISTFSQETGYKISKKILLINDTIKIDTLSIVPETFLMFDSLGNLISKDIYKIDYPNSILYLLPPAKVFINSYVEIKYQTFPFNFYQVFKNKNLLQQNENKEYDLKYNLNNYDNPFFDDVYAKDELQKIGSISRAISFGNSQDMSVSSGFNLQLSGKLTDDVRILAAITDKNIPIQPEGNTAQIQEFDKVFIQLMTNKSSVIAGDFEVYSGKTYFMKYYKKVRGGLVNTTLIDKKNDSSSFKLVTAAAIAKGKYARNYITPIEGNQGPYKLKGIDNESYIVILAGSEKVFINGQLLTRGKDNDYIIDYNNAEIYFTPKNLITQEKRIIVEFEYSERNYLRTMFITNTYYDTKKININFNLFSEQEHKNQPIQQNLSNESKQILAKAGDSLELTFVPDIEKTTFNTNEILYKMVDTIVAGIVYDSIFVFSTNPDSACYRVKFTDLGPGKGNYVQMISPVNGRVFKWVAPVNGVCQGNWEPVNSLIAPQTKQMFDCQINFKVNQKMTVGLETAISNYDKNTFSSLNDNNNVGNATKVWINKNFDLPSLKSKNWKFNTLATYEREGNNFTPIERYKTPEFERDWNIISNNSGNKHFSSLKFEFNNSQNGNKLGYDLSTLIISNSHYNSLRNNIYGNIKDKKNAFIFNSSLLTGKYKYADYKYLKNDATVSREIKFIKAGVNFINENNKLILSAKNDSLLPNSFAYNEFVVFMQNVDTATQYKYNVFYKGRNDFVSKNNIFSKSMSSYTSGFSINILKNYLNVFKVTGTFRQINVIDTALTKINAGQTFVGQLEHSSKILKKVISTNSFYETGSGMEAKKEFTYIEVAQGQGTYKWTDYNNNGIRELNEFDVAVFRDEANFVRIYVPTNTYIKTYYNQFNEVINLTPALWLNDKKGFLKIISKLTNTTSYRIEHKINNNSFDLSYFNPFVKNINDSLLVMLSSSLRSTLFYDRTGTKYSLDVSYQNTQNKNFLMTGMEIRMFGQVDGNIRINFTRDLTFRLNLLKSYKTSISEYFPLRNYKILTLSEEPYFAWQPTNTFRWSLMWNYTHKENVMGEINEKAFINKTSTEIRYNIPLKGSILAKVSYIYIKYNFSENLPITYEILEGLKKGSNVTWNINYQTNLSDNLQLSFFYDGRTSYNARTIHVGNIQLRAFF